MEQQSSSTVQCAADLKTLYQQLAEMADKTKQAVQRNRDSRYHATGPVLVIRGK